MQEILGDETAVGGTIHLKVSSKKKQYGRGTEPWLVGTPAASLHSHLFLSGLQSLSDTNHLYLLN